MTYLKQTREDKQLKSILNNLRYYTFNTIPSVTYQIKLDRNSWTKYYSPLTSLGLADADRGTEYVSGANARAKYSTVT